jgi:hypothetical protein
MILDLFPAAAAPKKVFSEGFIASPSLDAYL